MTFVSVILPASVVHWRLDGPAGPALDTLTAALIGAGVAVEPIAPGTAYRLAGPIELLSVLTAELNGIEGFTLAHELPPTDVVRMGSSLAPSHPFKRSVTVHGTGGAASFVARAVDLALSVASVGINRWSVSGRTSDLVAWLSVVYNKTPDELLTLQGWSPESIAAEDSPNGPAITVNVPTPSVNVTLPDRRTTSTIGRDSTGNIVSVVQLESDVRTPTT